MLVAAAFGWLEKAQVLIALTSTHCCREFEFFPIIFRTAMQNISMDTLIVSSSEHHLAPLSSMPLIQNIQKCP